MSEAPPSTVSATPSTMRYRHNATTASDGGHGFAKDRGGQRGPGGRMHRDAGASGPAGRTRQGTRGGGDRERQRRTQKEKENQRIRDEERFLRHLRTATAVVSAGIVVAVAYLACLLLVIDPELQSHLHLPNLGEHTGIKGYYDRVSSWYSSYYEYASSSATRNTQQQEGDGKTMDLDVDLEVDLDMDMDLDFYPNSDAGKIEKTDDSDAHSAVHQEGDESDTGGGIGDDDDDDDDDDAIDDDDDDDDDAIDEEGEIDETSSPIYTIPNSMDHIGDKSDRYALLRKEWDERNPPNDSERSLRALKEIVENNHEKNKFSSILHRLRPPPGNDADEEMNYDIYDCPDDPPPGYPREYKTIDVLRHWPPNQNLPEATTTAASDGEADDGDAGNGTQTMWAHLGICVFDYNRDYDKALNYRSNEVPFVVRNDPWVAETVERWNDEGYRRTLFGGLGHSGSGTTDANGSENDNGGVYADADASAAETNRGTTVHHRAERAVTNQILFRHGPKKKAPKTNTYAKMPPNRKREKTGPVRGKKLPPPTKLIQMTYENWYELAMEKERRLVSNQTSLAEGGDGLPRHGYETKPDRASDSYYYYFRLVGCGEKEGCEKNSTEYLFDELPFFQPRKSRGPSDPRSGKRSKPTKPRRGSPRGQTHPASPESTEPAPWDHRENLYLVELDKQRGIHCRFGMPGMIAANHYDASRNAIAVLGGTRRYVVSRPAQCRNLGLFPPGHPSARHSRVDWTTAPADYEDLVRTVDERSDEAEPLSPPSSSDNTVPWKEYNESLSLLANQARSTEVVLEAGDVLYLPSYWFHYIVSLDTNMQCNTRSGKGDGREDQTMTDCGFRPKKR